MNTDQWVQRVNALGLEIDEYAGSIAPTAWASDLYLQDLLNQFRTLAARDATSDTHQPGLPGVETRKDNLRCWHCGKSRPSGRKDQCLTIAEVEIGWRRSRGGDLGWGVNDLCCPNCIPLAGSTIQRDGVEY